MKVGELRVPILDEFLQEICTLRLVAGDNGPTSLCLLESSEALSHGEEVAQILEGRCYDFELIDAPTETCLRASAVLKPNSLRPSLGRLEPGLQTGLLEFFLESEGGHEVGRGALEVLSTKLSYRADYRGMLDFLANECSGLLFDLNAVGRLRLNPQFDGNIDNLQQRFEFISAEISSPGFQANIRQVAKHPHSQLRSVDVEVPLSRVGKVGKGLSMQLGKSGRRTLANPDQSPYQLLAGRGIKKPSLPLQLSKQRRTECWDTAENRFVKHTLLIYADFLNRFGELVLKSNLANRGRLADRAHHLENHLQHAISSTFLIGVGKLRIMPSGSPVLQRKQGYRQLLESWLKFDMSSQLAWQGGKDIYSSGKRNVATLYEYWVFFQILRLFRDKFSPPLEGLGSLFRESKDGFRMLLAAGKRLAIEGKFSDFGRILHARLSYNWNQDSNQDRETAGSWTCPMRPDYTLSFWPEGFTLSGAEAQELAVHIHFDAKYRVDDISELFGATGKSPKAKTQDGNFKREDLLKMHAYRDAIRRSEGAYVIYPGGDETATKFTGFHEILPGLGAFSIKPGVHGEGNGLQQLSEFIDDAVQHLCDRNSAREGSTYHLFKTYQSHNQRNSLTSSNPEEDESGIRATPPAEHPVLIGWCKSDEMLSWVKKSGLYNVRTGTRRGSVRLDPEMAATKHLLLHTKNSKAIPGLWKITERGPRIFTADDLIKKGYPSTPDPTAIYAVYDVEPDTFYSGWEWDYKALANRKAHRRSAEPFTASLSEVLLTKTRR